MNSSATSGENYRSFTRNCYNVVVFAALTIISMSADVIDVLGRVQVVFDEQLDPGKLVQPGSGADTKHPPPPPRPKSKPSSPAFHCCSPVNASNDAADCCASGLGK